MPMCRTGGTPHTPRSDHRRKSTLLDRSRVSATMVVATAREVALEAAVTRTRGTGTDPWSAWRSPQRDWLARLFDGYRYAIEAATDSRPRLGRDLGITQRLVRSRPPRVGMGAGGRHKPVSFWNPSLGLRARGPLFLRGASSSSHASTRDHRHPQHCR